MTKRVVPTILTGSLPAARPLTSCARSGKVRGHFYRETATQMWDVHPSTARLPTNIRRIQDYDEMLSANPGEDSSEIWVE